MSAALMGGSLFFAAEPASAYPQGCSSWYVQYSPAYSGGYGRSYCASGSGSHRVRVSCDRQYTSDVIRYGPWVGTGSYSTASCSSSETPRASWVQTQGD